MKNILVLILAIALLSGCGKETEEIKIPQNIEKNVELFALKDSVKIVPLSNTDNSDKFISTFTSNEYIKGFHVGENIIKGVFNGDNYTYYIKVKPKYTTYPEIHKILGEDVNFAHSFLGRKNDKVLSDGALRYDFDDYAISVAFKNNKCVYAVAGVELSLSATVMLYLTERFLPNYKMMSSALILYMNAIFPKDATMLVLYMPLRGIAIYYTLEEFKREYPGVWETVQY